MWTRAVSLQICQTLNVKDFLKSMQLHVFRFGIFQYCFSDLGSQIVAGSKLIVEHLNDIETSNYFQEHGMRMVKFDQYCKGNSSLGSLVEICIKQCKHMIFKSIKTNVLDFFEFQVVIAETECLVNKRPIALKNSLRDTGVEPLAITPEMLIHGRELVTVNIIPEMKETVDPDWNSSSDDIRTPIQETSKSKAQSQRDLSRRVYAKSRRSGCR